MKHKPKAKNTLSIPSLLSIFFLMPQQLLSSVVRSKCISPYLPFLANHTYPFLIIVQLSVLSTQPPPPSFLLAVFSSTYTRHLHSSSLQFPSTSSSFSTQTILSFLIHKADHIQLFSYDQAFVGSQPSITLPTQTPTSLRGLLHSAGIIHH